MGCGCSKSKKQNIEVKRSESVRPNLLSEEIKDRAAICSLCPLAKRVDGKPVGCSVQPENNLVSIIISKDSSCPKNKWANDSGIIKWLGILWYGVPYPKRIWLNIRYGKDIEQYKGCGCIKALKDLRNWFYKGIPTFDME